VAFSEVLNILELAILAAIAGLLYQLLKESKLLRRRIETGREKKDGQTINVNLAPVALTEGKSASLSPPVKEPEEKKESESEGTDEPAEPLPPPKPLRSLGSVTVTTGGAIAIKCPKCGAENSSYRSECFSCGAPLR